MSEITKRQRRLKNYWLNPSYQRRYIFRMVCVGLVLVAFNAAVFYTFTRENYAILVDLSPMTDEAKALLYKELRQIIGYLVMGGVGFLLVVAFAALAFSHQTVGPLYHFKRVFSEIAKGNRTARVKLRPTDDFQDVAQAFNEMMDSLPK